MAGPKPKIERHLLRIGARLQELQRDLQVTDEQLLHLADQVDEARIRALVAETSAAKREHKLSERHMQRLSRHRAKIAKQIADAQATQDRLLDQLSSH